MLSSLRRPVIFAHRGASSDAPENTLPAFQLAIDQGVEAVELDVQLTADEEVVVFHDLNLDRTTNGSGPLGMLNLADLKCLDAGKGHYPSFQGVEIPTLREVLNQLPDRILLNIELKNLTTPLDPLPELAARVISSCQAEERVLISSFNPSALERFHKAIPEAPLGRLLYGKVLIWGYRILPSLSSRFRSIHLPFTSLSRAAVARFHRLGLEVFTYTVNTPQDILNAARMGADGIFTDHPLRAIDLLWKGI